MLRVLKLLSRCELLCIVDSFAMILKRNFISHIHYREHQFAIWLRLTLAGCHSLVPLYFPSLAWMKNKWIESFMMIIDDVKWSNLRLPNAVVHVPNIFQFFRFLIAWVTRFPIVRCHPVMCKTSCKNVISFSQLVWKFFFSLSESKLTGEKQENLFCHFSVAFDSSWPSEFIWPCKNK